MKKAADTWDTGMHPSLKITAVQMPPRAIGRVIIHGEFHTTFRAGKREKAAVSEPNIDPFLFRGYSDAMHGPRGSQA
jgi:hypothetical protein